MLRRISTARSIRFRFTEIDLNSDAAETFGFGLERQPNLGLLFRSQRAITELVRADLEAANARNPRELALLYPERETIRTESLGVPRFCYSD
jgi:hypothetical protein